MMCPRAQRRGRIALARLVIAEGGNLTRYARLLGISTPGALFWLRRHANDLVPMLADGRGRHETPIDEALFRLVLMRAVEDIPGGLTRLSEATGMRVSMLVEFRKRWAPDGLDAAIADLWPGEANGKYALKRGLNNVLPEMVQRSAHG